MAIILNTDYYKTDWSPYFLAMKDYATEYDKEQLMYDALAEKLGTLSTAVLGSTEAKGIYDDYMSLLLDASANFGRGRNINTIRLLGLLRHLYGTKIKLLEKALELWNLEIKELQALKQDPYMILSRDAMSSNLDTYLNGAKGYDYVSGSKISQTVAEALENYAKQYVKAGLWSTTAQGLLLERINQSGLSSLDVLAIMQGGEEARRKFPDIYKIIDGAVLSTGIQNWNNEKALNAAYESAYRGLPFAMGEQKIDTQKNAAYLSPYELWKWQKEQWEFGREKQKAAIEDALLQALLGGGSDESIMENLMYDAYGNTIDINTDKDFELINNDIKSLLRLSDSNKGTNGKFKGQTISPTIEKIVYANPTLLSLSERIEAQSKVLDDYVKLHLNIKGWDRNKDSKYLGLVLTLQTLAALWQTATAIPGSAKLITKIVENPDYEVFTRYKKKYGTSSSTRMLLYALGELKKIAENKRVYAYHGADLRILIDDILTNALVGVDTDNIPSNILSLNGKAISSDKNDDGENKLLKVIRNDSHAKVAVNPISGKLQIISASGTIDVNPAALSHITIEANDESKLVGVTQNITADKYLKMIAERNKKRNFMNQSDVLASNAEMLLLMNYLDALAHSFIPGSTSTDKDFNTAINSGDILNMTEKQKKEVKARLKSLGIKGL